jgi:nucleoside-diphosphate-sugar epimerase
MWVNPLTQDLDHILDHTRELWEQLRGQRLFITGGTGFFGTWLLESLLWAKSRLCLDLNVTVLTRNPDHFVRNVPHLAANSCVTLHRGDIRSFEFPEGRFTVIIHAAGPLSGDPHLLSDTVVSGARRVLDFVVHCGAKRVLFTSSGAIYGMLPAGMMKVDEDFQGAVDSASEKAAYAEGKRAAEALCVLYAKEYGVEVKIARCFALVGPYQPLSAGFAIADFLMDGISGRAITVMGDGTPCRSYLYAADLCIWLWTILLRGASCRPYNVGSDSAISIADLAHFVAQAFPHKPEVNIMSTPCPGRTPEYYVPSVSRASSELGLKQWIQLPEAIEKTIGWLRKTRAFDSQNDTRRVDVE